MDLSALDPTWISLQWIQHGYIGTGSNMDLYALDPTGIEQERILSGLWARSAQRQIG